MNRVCQLGCIVCYNLNYKDSPAEIHHIRTGKGMGQRASHYEVIGLCPRHHRLGDEAFHASPKAWQDKYGTELELLEQVRELLGDA